MAEAARSTETLDRRGFGVEHLEHRVELGDREQLPDTSDGLGELQPPPLFRTVMNALTSSPTQVLSI